MVPKSPATSGRLSLLDGVLNPAVTLLFQFQGQLLAARLHDTALEEDEYPVGDDVVEQALVVRDDQDGPILAAQSVHAVGHDTERVNVEAGISFIKDGQLRIEHRQLKDLVT